MKRFGGVLEIAIEACKLAGSKLIEIRRDKHRIKIDGDQLKTSADTLSDNLIRRVIQDKRPGDFILSEETYNQTGTSQFDHFWIVDPLDGTKSYIEGFQGFCVQIAYFSDMAVKVGVVYSPSDDTTYWATENGEAFKEFKNRTIKIKVSDEIKTYIESKKATNKVARILSVIGAAEFVECGSYGLKLCRVAEGKADVFIKEHNFKIWDVAPGNLILSEAGGILTTWSGEAINYRGKFDYKNLLACSRKNSSSILSKISLIVR